MHILLIKRSINCFRNLYTNNVNIRIIKTECIFSHSNHELRWTSLLVIDEPSTDTANTSKTDDLGLSCPRS